MLSSFTCKYMYKLCFTYIIQEGQVVEMPGDQFFFFEKLTINFNRFWQIFLQLFEMPFVWSSLK